MFPIVLSHVELMKSKSDHAVGPFGYVIFLRMEALFLE